MHIAHMLTFHAFFIESYGKWQCHAKEVEMKITAFSNSFLQTASIIQSVKVLH